MWQVATDYRSITDREVLDEAWKCGVPDAGPILSSQPVNRERGQLCVPENCTVKNKSEHPDSLLCPPPQQARRRGVWLIIAFLQPFNPGHSGTTNLLCELSHLVRGSNVAGGKNTTLVLGTGCVTQAALVISSVPLKGKANDDSGSNPGCTTL